jgi:hypothetical protein
MTPLCNRRTSFASIPFQLAILFLFLCTVSFGQDLKYIYGKVVDSKNGAPLAFASIVQKDKSVGLISNEDGSFKIPSYFATTKVTLVVSFIGYYPEEIQVETLNKQGLNIIKLVEKTESLNEIVIKNDRYLTPHQIVEFAIKNIKKNYPLDPFTYVGYYRDYQKNKDNDYLNLNEAILQVHDRGFRYKDFESTNTNILKYEQNQDFPVDATASKLYDYHEKTKVIDNAKLGYLTDNTNEFVILRVHDAIRNYNLNTYDYVNTLETDFVRNHNFILVKETSIDDVALYEIKAMKQIGKITAEGTLFISKNDFKIYKFQYAVYEHKSRKAAKSRFKRKKKLVFNVVVEYANYNELMYPKYISFKNPFEVLQPPKFLPIDAQYIFVNKPNSTSMDPAENILLFVDIVFNNIVDPKRAFKKRNYNISYKETQIGIDSIHVWNDTIRVFPNDKESIYAKRAWLAGLNIGGKDFSMELKNIKDVDGNVVFQGKMAPFVQYREFFIQELKTDTQRPKNVTNMIKFRPLSTDQPINSQKDISQYWMNTPLQSKEE